MIKGSKWKSGQKRKDARGEKMKNYCQFRTVTFGGVEEDFLPPFSSILFGILLRRVIKDVIGLHYERERDPKQPPIKMCFSLPPKEKDKEKLSVLASFRKKEEKSCSFPIWGEKATAGKFIAALSAPLRITFFFSSLLTWLWIRFHYFFQREG